MSLAATPSLLDTLRAIDWPEIATAGGDTLLMLGGSLLFTALLGLPLGVALYLFDRDRLVSSPKVYTLLSLVVNVLRSLPFVILLIVLIWLVTRTRSNRTDERTEEGTRELYAEEETRRREGTDDL